MIKKILDIDILAKNFIHQCQQLPKIRVAVIYPSSPDSLSGAYEAAQLGLIEPLLIGPKEKMQEIANDININIDHFECIDIAESYLAAEKAVCLVREGKAEALMKGNLHTDEMMREVIRSDVGLRTHRRISHVFIMAVEGYHKPFIITDAAININPNLMTKKDIIQNAVDLFHALKKDSIPKVAILSAVETINPDIPSTIDAACLVLMSQRGQITDAIVDGPFAYDNVVSLHAAKTKNITSSVVGDADIFLVPNLEAGNMLAKQLVLLTEAVSAGLILGAKVPIIFSH